MVQSAMAQSANTLITGNVKGDLAGSIKLTIDETYLDNTTAIQTVDIVEGKFAFAVQIDFPQFVTLRYARNEVELYLEPNDTLQINFDADKFRFDMQFAGRCGDNNRFWLDYVHEFLGDFNEFDMEYLGVGTFYYRLLNSTDELMRKSDEETFTTALRREMLFRQGKLDFAVQEKQLHLTEKFITFMHQEIAYDRAYKMLAYGHIYGGMHHLDKAFLKPLDDISISDDQAFNSPKYRDYVLARMNYLAMNYTSPDDPYMMRYKLASTYLGGLTKSFYQSDIIARAFRDEMYDLAIPLYEDFLKTNPYEEFDHRATDAYQLASRFAPGSAAPLFTLTDINGQDVKLSSFKGKVVYLDFWATWCRPCVQKLAQLKSVETQFAQAYPDIVFIHLSLDQNPQTWENYVRSNTLTGQHLIIAGGIEAPVCKAYDIKSVPRFFLIDKKGNFAATPPTHDLQTLMDNLIFLNDKP